jgi:hypothetical protein
VSFKVISPTSGHIDRIVKLREYAAVDSILRYVIVESSSISLTVHERQTAGQKWTVTSVMAGDLLSPPEIGIEIVQSMMISEHRPLHGNGGDNTRQTKQNQKRVHKFSLPDFVRLFQRDRAGLNVDLGSSRPFRRGLK